MNDQHITFSPERNQWTLTDGRHHMEVPEWAREIMRDEFERETRPLRDNLDLALDSKRIAERRVTGLLAENAKLRELVAAYDSALMRMCDQTQSLYSKSDSYPCDECVLGKGHGFDRCGINELQEEAHEMGIEV